MLRIIRSTVVLGMERAWAPRDSFSLPITATAVRDDAANTVSALALGATVLHIGRLDRRLSREVASQPNLWRREV